MKKSMKNFLKASVLIGLIVGLLLVASACQKKTDELVIRIGSVAPLTGTQSQYGIMFARGHDELRNTVNGALRALRRDGAYDRLYQKWFG